MLISSALEGKFIRSSQGEGIIQQAEIRNNVATPDRVFAYAVQVRPHREYGKIYKEDFWTTIYVGLDD